MFKKILLWLLGLLALAVIGLIVTANLRYNRTFDAPYPNISASTDSALIARGRYLAYGPAHCAHCHAPMEDFARVEKGEHIPLKGGFNFDLPLGTIYAPNITPDPETGIGKLTDGEIARALRYGVRHDGRAMIDFMPFYDLSDYDLQAVLSFLRSQEPIRNPRPQNDFNLMGKAIMAFAIKPMGDGEVPAAPPADSSVEYGRYLVNSVANCRGCHTERNMATGAYVGPELAGGTKFEFIDENGKVFTDRYFLTPNLTPDPETGRMNGWTKAAFIQRFRTGKLMPGSPMPWGPFSNMSDMELTAIYKYLISAEPVRREIPAGLIMESEG